MCVCVHAYFHVSFRNKTSFCRVRELRLPPSITNILCGGRGGGERRGEGREAGGGENARQRERDQGRIRSLHEREGDR